eukprot:TRINITY_DN808_c0_g1_i1.p1 TRINITY_DN808_c0_g1~~TRINITY_DN808_c0_g1_i1.p1  ORF type:complete len:385 (-),score=98.86 TRINITY_DN808_c0_g1_i1:35-1189(-)
MQLKEIIYTLATILLAIELASAHGRLTMPESRGMYNNKMIWEENNPVASPIPNQPAAVPSEDDQLFICRNDPPLPEDKWTTYTSGEQASIKWDFTALHVGDCYVYLTYDTDLPDPQKKWFKIAEFGDCQQFSGQTMTYQMPSNLPSCDHCILRWEWTAHHVYPSIELYTQCSDIQIIGSGSTALPDESYLVNIPGHIPYDSSFYRDQFNGEMWPSKKVGPAVYTGTPSNEENTEVVPDEPKDTSSMKPADTKVVPDEPKDTSSMKPAITEIVPDEPKDTSSMKPAETKAVPDEPKDTSSMKPAITEIVPDPPKDTSAETSEKSNNNASQSKYGGISTIYILLMVVGIMAIMLGVAIVCFMLGQNSNNQVVLGVELRENLLNPAE